MEGLSKSGTCGNARNRSQRFSYPIVVLSQTIRQQVKHMVRPVSAATLSLPTYPCPKTGNAQWYRYPVTKHPERIVQRRNAVITIVPKKKKKKERGGRNRRGMKGEKKEKKRGGDGKGVPVSSRLYMITAMMPPVMQQRRREHFLHCFCHTLQSFHPLAPSVRPPNSDRTCRARRRRLACCSECNPAAPEPAATGMGHSGIAECRE